MLFQSILTKQGKTNSWNLQKIKCQNKGFNFYHFSHTVMFLTFSRLYQHFNLSCTVDVLGTKVHLKWELGMHAMWSNFHVAIIAKAFITVYSIITTTPMSQSDLLLAGVPSALVFSTKTLICIISVYYVNISDVIAKQAGKKHYMHIFKS